MSERIELRERETASFGGRTCLRVYPHLAPDAPDAHLAFAGHVEALRFFNREGQLTEGVQINLAYDEPLTREKSDRLKAAIDRGWEWLDATREAAAQKQP